MLKIKLAFKQAIIEQAREDRPLEACGVIVGKAYGGGADDRLIKMDNIAEEWGTSFQFDPDAQLALWNDMEWRNEVLVAVYHSHTRHDAYPSERDIAGALWPGTHYIIVSVKEPTAPVFKSYFLNNGDLVPEPIEEL